jgi:adenylate kinase
MTCYTFIGIQGSQSIMLSHKLNFQHINTGDLFRTHIKNQTDLGKKIQEVILKGDLVQDNLVFDLILTSTDQNAHGLIFDGFPRTVSQAEYLMQHFELKRVFYLELDESTALERITSRRICSKCPENYNLISKPPIKANTCDKCSSALVIRQDDQPEAVKKRFSLFFDQTRPLIEMFDDKGILSVINAKQTVEEIYKKVLSEISSA